MTTTAGHVDFAVDPREAARRVLTPEDCVLLVIDIQEKLLPAIFNRDTLLKNSQMLLRMAQVLSLPVLVTTQYSQGLGGTVPEIASLIPGNAATHDKVEFGCFGNADFCSALKQVPGRRTTLLVCGMETHICVLQTVLGGLNQGYLVHVASDAVGSRSEWNWHIGLTRMQDAGAVISSTEMMIYELFRVSKSPAFKAFLPYLKG